MLLRLEVENFYSIRERQILDFTVPRTTPESDRYGACRVPKAERVPHVIAFFGGNASGKTSFLRAVTFLHRFITSSFDKYRPDDDIDLRPFDRKDSSSGKTWLAMEIAPSEWMVEVLIKDDFGDVPSQLYRYELEIDHSSGRSIVSKETISVSDGSRVFTKLFDRILVEDTYKITAHKDFELARNDPRKSVRKNVSLISSLVQFDHRQADIIKSIFRYTFFSNLVTSKYKMPEDVVTEFFSDKDYLLEALNKKIRIIDLGIERVEISESDGKKKPLFYHVGLDRPQSFQSESLGTQSFYLNFLDIFMALSTGAVAVMDELDADLHPNLMAEIIRWFQDRAENPQGGQLIMSCHNASVISDLEKDEVWLTSKQETGETTVTPLSSFKGLRRDANLYSKYLSGEFGAVPQFG